MKKILKIISVSILFLAFLCLFAYVVRHVTLGGKRLGVFTGPLKAFSSFPSTAKSVLTSDEIKGIPPTYVERDTIFQQINILDQDLYGLSSFFNNQKNLWEIKLFNFKNDSVIHTWKLYKEDYLKVGVRKFENSRPRNPLLLPDRSLIVLCAESNNFFRLDSSSNIIWHNTNKNFHHSINLGLDGNIWTCTSGNRGLLLGNQRKQLVFRDDYVTKLDINTGKILYDKSISEILIENGYYNFIYGFSNYPHPKGETDPFHLNDIEPVFKDGPFWKKGDLFLSLRHKSLVIHYRPDSNKIIRLIYGPFLYQHDVDIISDSEIAIFNNNTTNLGLESTEEDDSVSNQIIHDKLVYSGIIIYNYQDSSYRTYLKDLFGKENIYTRTEGIYEFLNKETLYLESQNEAKVYIIKNNEVLLKKQFDTSLDDKVHLPNWVRIYEKINF
ncbi:MAG: hypothetical protein JXB49_32585 [Bacteroidales bacterium]|nr:hypothetical protein [Bacteroidales bacterium]